jgi:hypothetical protein
MMQLDWSKRNAIFFGTVLKSDAASEVRQKPAKLQWQQNHRTKALTWTAVPQRNALDGPLFRFRSTCNSWLMNAK